MPDPARYGSPSVGGSEPALTLGGLRRWALWGAQAHQRDLDGQMAYFGLQTESARSVLQKERRGTLFIDTQRKLNFYLRALWGRDFFLRPAATDHEGFKPYVDHRVLHMPDAVDDIAGIKGVEVYRQLKAARMLRKEGKTSDSAGLASADGYPRARRRR